MVTPDHKFSLCVGKRLPGVVEVLASYALKTFYAGNGKKLRVPFLPLPEPRLGTIRSNTQI
jgi:hypothetical protein